jgi:hypothetical protein
MAASCKEGRECGDASRKSTYSTDSSRNREGSLQGGPYKQIALKSLGLPDDASKIFEDFSIQRDFGVPRLPGHDFTTHPKPTSERVDGTLSFAVIENIDKTTCCGCTRDQNLGRESTRSLLYPSIDPTA